MSSDFCPTGLASDLSAVTNPAYVASKVVTGGSDWPVGNKTALAVTAQRTLQFTKHFQ